MSFNLYSKLSGSKVFISNNTSERGAGMFFVQSNGDIKNITVANNNGIGIVLDRSRNLFDQITISNNKSIDSFYGIVQESSNRAFAIKNSNIINYGYAIKNPSMGYETVAKNNYWGDSSGPYHPSQNILGKGDSVSGFVNVDPWLTKPNTDAPPIPPQNLRVDYSGLEPVISWDESKMEDFKNF